MVTPKITRLFIIVVLCLTMPIRQLFAAMPEIRPISLNHVEMAVSQSMQTQLDLTKIHFVEYDPVIVDSKVLDAILGGDDEEAIIPGLPNGLTFDNAEEKLQDDLLIPGQERNGRKKLVIGLTLLLAASLITALFAFLAGSGSGAGSASAAGGGGFGPSGNNPSGDSGAGDGDGGSGGPGGNDPKNDIFGPGIPPTDPTGGNPGNNPTQQLQLLNSFAPFSSVPNNPEPATMLLTLLGLGLPFLRKRFFHE
jgi:hypothetical protein